MTAPIEPTLSAATALCSQLQQRGSKLLDKITLVVQYPLLIESSPNTSDIQQFLRNSEFTNPKLINPIIDLCAFADELKTMDAQAKHQVIETLSEASADCAEKHNECDEGQRFRQVLNVLLQPEESEAIEYDGKHPFTERIQGFGCELIGEKMIPQGDQAVRYWDADTADFRLQRADANLFSKHELLESNVGKLADSLKQAGVLVIAMLIPGPLGKILSNHLFGNAPTKDKMISKTIERLEFSRSQLLRMKATPQTIITLNAECQMTESVSRKNTKPRHWLFRPFRRSSFLPPETLYQNNRGSGRAIASVLVSKPIKTYTLPARIVWPQAS